jgi:predicted Zn-dependent peptidase
MKKLILFTCILALLASLPAMGQKQAEKQKPPVGDAPKPFTLPAVERFTLPNGIQVALVPYGAVPKVEVLAVVKAGVLNESADQVWLSNLNALLMKEGTKKRSAKEVDETAAGMGGDLDISASGDVTNVSLDVLSEFGPQAAKLIAEVLQQPLLPGSEVERLKGDLLRRLTVAKTQPGQLALERFRQVLYPDHPYGRVFPTEDMLKKYTVDDVQKFYADNFGAKRTRIYVGGKFDRAAMRKTITDAFKDWKPGSDPVVNIPKPVAKHTIEQIERAGAPQSTLYVGLPVIDPSNPDYIPLSVMNALLGGSFGSRITANIREAKGYTYSPFSQVSSRYRDAYWVQVADVTTAHTGDSLKEIFYEINRLRSEPPTAAELDGIKNYIGGTFVIQNSSRNGLLNYLSYVDTHGLGDKYMENFVKNVHAVTPAQVQEMAKKYIDPDKMAVVVVGDKQQVTAQLAPFEGQGAGAGSKVK